MIFTIFSFLSAVMMLAMIVIVGGGLLAVQVANRRGNRLLASELISRIAIGTIIFQIGHVLEHSVQLGYWLGHPFSPPYMSPIAAASSAGLATFVGHAGSMTVGMEVLHLTGNSIFWLGLLAWRQRSDHPYVTLSYRLQSFHMVEHIALTATILLTGHAIGLSTVFGFGDSLPAPWGPAIRVWFHFLMNLVVTVAVLLAIYARRRESSTTTPTSVTV